MAFQVKLCGIRDAATLALATDLGADYVGFIFYPPSPRSLDIFAAAELASAVPDHVATVGVLVDPDDRMLDALLAHVSLDMLQLHGAETPERVRAIREHTGCRLMKAIRVREAADLCDAEAFVGLVDLVMLDAKPPIGATLPGGNGESFDWAMLADFAPRVPWALAGGLNADNLADAVARAGAAIYDVSSGVESTPGVKDPARVREFLTRAAALRGTPLSK